MSAKSRGEADRRLDNARGVANDHRVDLLTPQQIRAIRLDFGVGQQELAEYLGVNVATISRWETGRSAPQLEHRKVLLQLSRGGRQGGQALPQRALIPSGGSQPVVVVVLNGLDRQDLTYVLDRLNGSRASR